MGRCFDYKFTQKTRKKQSGNGRFLYIILKYMNARQNDVRSYWSTEASLSQAICSMEVPGNKNKTCLV